MCGGVCWWHEVGASPIIVTATDTPTLPTLPMSAKTSGEEIAESVAHLWSQKSSERLEGAVELRKKLAIEENPPIDEVIEAHAVGRLVELLNDVDVQFEGEVAGVRDVTFASH